jgi:chromosome segregation ATPase
MFKLIKWGVVLTAVGAALLYITFGTSAPSYVGAALGKARDSVKEAIPIDFEIQRSARLIQKIEPQIQECLRDVAVGEVELADLRDSIGEMEKRSEVLHAKLLRRKGMLESGEAVYYVAGLRMQRSRLENDLERVFEDYRNLQSLIKTKHRLLKNQEKSLVAARRKLEAVLAERAHLKDMLKSLKTQKRQVDALAAQSRKFELDDSSLVQARQSLKEVKKRLDVAQKMLEADLINLSDLDEEGVSPSTRPDRDIVQEVNSYLRGQALPPVEGSASEAVTIPLVK